MISLEKLETRWGKLEKLELEILEMFPYRTLGNKAGSSPAGDIGPGSFCDHLQHQVHGGTVQVQKLVPAPEVGAGQAPDGGCPQESQPSLD